MKFSVVIPTYKCSRSIPELTERLIKTLEQLSSDFEIIYVNDASPENDWEVITELSQNDNRIKGINFSRNFGQHYAITAGLDNAKGDWVVVMDGDLQDQPEEIIKLYNKAQEGYDIVLAQRVNRQDGFWKKKFSKLYYSLLSYLTNTKIDYRVGTFRLLSKQVVAQFNEMREFFRFFGAMINWLGYKIAYVNVEHNQREFGKSTYNLKKSMNLAINGILSFSDKPLRLTVKAGVIIVLISGIFILYKVILAVMSSTPAIGWSSLIATILFSTGTLIVVLGVIGLYIGRIFEQVKQRPLYIIKSKTKNI